MGQVASSAQTNALQVAIADQRLLDALGNVRGADLVQWDMRSPSPRAQWDIVVPPYLGGVKPLDALRGIPVRLVQSQSIGYDGVAERLEPGVLFANAATVHETSTAELAVGLAIAAQRGIADFVRATDAGKWSPSWRPSLADRRVLLLGYGGVARAIERRLAPFEVQLTRMARTAREVPGENGATIRVHGIAELPQLLPESEIVILAVPLDASTRGLIAARELALMPDGALLVNVARGAVVNTDALVAELMTGRIRAALDVTDPEPLPPGHPLFQAPGLLLTPHVGGASSAMPPRIAALVRRQVERMLRGDSPENVVLGR